MTRIRAACGVLAASSFVLFTSVPLAYSQRGGGARASAAPPNVETEEGIPVTDPLVVSKCGTCHAKDDKGNLSRISWERSTPEGWSEALKRMVRLNGLTITPQEARSVVKYLATYHGLSPEESKPVMYLPEHRIIDETNIPNDTVRGACTTCHAMGRPLSWRRSKNDWRLLTNLHVALYAQAEAHFRRSLMPGAGAAGGGAGGAGRGAAGAGAAGGAGALAATPAQEPVEAAIDFLGNSAPLHTPEWAAWRSRMRAPKLAGRWLITAHLPGKGDYTGEMIVEAGAADDEFKTKINLRSLKDGSTISRTGNGLVYAGYSWRGRSQTTGKTNTAPDDTSREMREALWFSPDQSTAEGRWFWGEYQEFGLNVKLERASSEPKLLSLDRTAIKSGSQGNRVRLVGDHFPAQVAASDLDFGSGVKVAKVVSHNSGEIVVELECCRGRRFRKTRRIFPKGGFAKCNRRVRPDRLHQGSAGNFFVSPRERGASEGLSAV